MAVDKFKSEPADKLAGPPATFEPEIKKWREKIETYSKLKFDQNDFKVQQHFYDC